MSHCTEVETVKAAKKPHRCCWCWQKIEAGQPYMRYRYYSGGDASTVKEHPECHAAMEEAYSEGILETGEEFMPGQSPRGCNCGFDRDCPRCHPVPHP